MPALFNKLGVRFQYPENWTLETDASAPGPAGQSVSVYSPGGAFWTVMAHSRQSDPGELTREALAEMRREYQELDSEAVRENVGNVELVGFDLNFYCLDLTNTAWIRAGRTRSKTILVICQGDDREFDQVADVFRAMTTSLLTG